MKRLNDKVIVITGASSGIGRATALEAAQRGAQVVVAARRAEALEALAHECADLGGICLAVPTDISKQEDVRNLYQKAIERFGQIDVWVNNAAVTLLGPLDETPIEDIKRLFDVNILGYVHGAQVVIPHFKAREEGILINISSMVGITGQPYSTAYNMSKFAIRGLSYSLEQELSDIKGIKICTVMPAVIDTPLFSHAANYMGREVKAPEPVIPAQEVADAILKLISKPQKEVIVGTMGRLTTMARTIAPKLFDKKFKGMIEDNHFKNAPDAPTSGNLYEPMPQWAQVSGEWMTENGHSEKNKPAKKFAFAGITLAGVLLGASLLLKRSR